MPATWLSAMQHYSYPVNLAEFKNAGNYAGFFNFPIGYGDRAPTVLFEAHFRAHASTHIAPWIEVVFWKNFSGPGKQPTTSKHESVLTSPTAKAPTTIWGTLSKFIRIPTRIHFGLLLDDLALSVGKSPSGRKIATASTFAAFADPTNFPIIDRVVAQWVNENFVAHNSPTIPGRPVLLPFTNSSNGLSMSHWSEYIAWVKWCQHMRDTLNGLGTGHNWRARDVELAVFSTQRCHPHLALSVL